MRSKMTTAVILLSIFLTVRPELARANAEAPAGGPNAALIVSAEESAPKGEDELRLKYDPKDLDADATSKEDSPSTATLKEAADQMRTSEYLKRLNDEVVVPTSFEEADLLQNALDLSPEHRAIFLTRKTRFLDKTARGLQTLRLRPASINKMLALMNKAFFQNAAVVAEANSKVVSLQVAGGVGAGVLDWLMKALKKSPLLGDIPDRAGFYLMLSTGFTIVEMSVDGHRRFSIEPIFDIRRATKIFSPFMILSPALTTTLTLENRDGSKSLRDKMGFYRISALNVISDPRHFGFAFSVGPPFPPFTGAIASFKGDIHRFRVTPSNIGGLARSFLTKLRRRSPRVCIEAYAEDFSL